jgi:integrase/recombinase XerD
MHIPDHRDCPGTGILSRCVDVYVGYLKRQQYRPAVIRAYLRSVEHFVAWAARRRAPLLAIDEPLIQRFVTEHLPVCRCPDPCLRTLPTVRAALARLLDSLRSEGLIPEKRMSAPSCIGDELARFDGYLDSVCGLAPSTRTSRRQWLNLFLRAMFASTPISLHEIQPRDIVHFITRSLKLYKPGTLGVVTSTLRSYLRFRAVNCGDGTESLMAAIPAVARWPMDSVPKYLTVEEIDRFLAAFDQRSANGRRDYAMARCLVDMGLRAGEVAAIQLEHLNWREGTLTIPHGKSRRADVLPLPVATGKAMMQYVRAARPPSTSRALFVRHRAPQSVPITAKGVSNAIRRAFEHSGLGRCAGTHVLRHSAAVRMRWAGASLKEIADVLRHRSLDTTMIYSKVDLPRLAAVAGPWPGGLS